MEKLQKLVDNIPKNAKVDKKQKECLQAIMLASDGGKAGFERALGRLRDLIDELEEGEWKKGNKKGFSTIGMGAQGSFGDTMFRHVE